LPGRVPLNDMDIAVRAAGSCIEGMIIATHEELLRRLALHDEPYIQSALGIHLSDNEAAGLDPKTHALVRLSALVALDAAPVSYSWAVETALAVGATDDEIIATIITVAPITGVARVVTAAPWIALALGYDVDQAFEALDRDSK
jgi:4-carboxymuconolactone decarboxylase